MNQAIINRANQLLNDKEYGHELTWDKAVRFAQEEAAEKTAAQAERARKATLWNQYKAELRAAGVTSEAAMKVLAPTDAEAFSNLPMVIAIGRIQFTSTAKKAAVKAAITKLWAAIGYGQPDFTAETYTKQTYVKWGF
jgi:hypothetical protein